MIIKIIIAQQNVASAFINPFFLHNIQMDNKQKNNLVADPSLIRLKVPSQIFSFNVQMYVRACMCCVYIGLMFYILHTHTHIIRLNLRHKQGIFRVNFIYQWQ